MGLPDNRQPFFIPAASFSFHFIETSQEIIIFANDSLAKYLIMTTAEKVRGLIEKSGLSQKAFSESESIHPVSMSNYLKNDNFSMKALKKIAEAQGVSISSLLPTKREKKIVTTPLINGYIEYDGKIEAIRSIDDLRMLLERISPSIKPISESIKEPFALLFDLDNTLINSDAKRPLLKQRPLDWQAINAQIPKYRLYDGIEDVLHWAKDNGIKVGIVSSTKKDHIEKVLKHFNLTDYFDIIIGNQRSYKKPHPKLIEMALESLGAKAEKALYIGDHEEDAEMCSRAKIRFVGCLWDSWHKKELAIRGCKTITKPQEIMGLFDSFEEIPLLVPNDTKKEKPQYDIRCSDEGYAYFYMNVPLSNWWDSVPAIEYDGHTFNASESIFMYLKAQCFNDEEIAEKIVEADNMTYDRPKKRWDAVKKLGKKVRGFDDKIWARHNRDAMYTALKQKALYDEEFKRVLLDPQYAGMTFVEASKYDKIWGIGIDANTAMRVGKAGWQGHNFLGRALTDLRNELRPDLQ